MVRIRVVEIKFLIQQMYYKTTEVIENSNRYFIYFVLSTMQKLISTNFTYE